MIFKNMYKKIYLCYQIIARIIFLIVLNADMLVFFISPQMFVDMTSVFLLFINLVFTGYILYSIFLSITPKVVLSEEYLVIYSIHKLNVKEKILIENILSVGVIERKIIKYDTNAIVLEVVTDKTRFYFALNEYDYRSFLSQSSGRFCD